MNSWLLLITIFNVFVIIHGQTWAGVYRWSSTCDQTKCCCGRGTMTIRKISSSVLGIVTGANNQCPVPVIYENLINVNGYTIDQKQSFGTVRWTLSSDSRTVTLTSASLPSICNDRAIKNSAIKSTHLFQLMSTLVIGSLWMKLIHF